MTAQAVASVVSGEDRKARLVTLAEARRRTQIDRILAETFGSSSFLNSVTRADPRLAEAAKFLGDSPLASLSRGEQSAVEKILQEHWKRYDLTSQVVRGITPGMLGVAETGIEKLGRRASEEQRKMLDFAMGRSPRY